MQSINFEFLKEQNKELALLGAFAESYVHSDPASALVKLRAFGENLVADLIVKQEIPRYYQPTFVEMLKILGEHGVVPPVVLDKLHFLHDLSKGHIGRRIYGFYNLQSVRYCLWQTENREELGSKNPDPLIVDRNYQIEAIKRVSEQFDKGRRKALIVQATGTGKTRVAIAMAELMIRCKWVKRVLFLCDRRELRKQAYNAFGEYIKAEPRVYITAKTADDRTKRIYLATYPAMMKCFQKFDVGFFDLVIADESHRSIYNRYRDLFLYFDAYQVGLTATPRDVITHNTYSLFECGDKDPTAYYSYDDAITHDPPYLSRYKNYTHTTQFLRIGIKYSEMTEQQKSQLEDQVEDAELVDYSKEAVDKSVFNKDTDRRIIRNLMEHGNKVYHYPGDLLHPYQEHIDSGMFHGFDFDATMLRIAAMNMLLHNITSPCIEYKDTLSEQGNVARDYKDTFDVVLANPPFKGSIDVDNVYKGLISVAKTKKTELLFLVLIEKILKIGGCCAVIVPDGVLFGASKAHKSVRSLLVESNQLEAVVSLPSGVFKPYAGVSTAVLFFTKGGRTDDVFFYNVAADGYSLDDKRTAVKEDDLPDMVEKWELWKKNKDVLGKKEELFGDRKAKSFFVPKSEIVEQNYDLSINRYAEVLYEEIKYDPPQTILKKMRDLENAIITDMDELEVMIK